MKFGPGDTASLKSGRVGADGRTSTHEVEVFGCGREPRVSHYPYPVKTADAASGS